MESKIPVSIVQEMLTVADTRHRQNVETIKYIIDVQNKYFHELLREVNSKHDAQLALLGEHLKECARLFELALNPPVPPYDPNDKIAEQVFANPRMSEEEEDLRHAYRMGDIDEVEFQRRLDIEFKDAYQE